MVVLVLIAYLTLGIVCTKQCVAVSKRHGVVSSFSLDNAGDGFLTLLWANPFHVPLVAFFPFGVFYVPLVAFFVIAFWPALCLWDLAEIPGKRKEKLRLLKAMRQEKAHAWSHRHAIWGHDERLDGLIGQSGKTVSVLSPMGRVRIAGQNFDAASIDGYLAVGQPVIVTGRRGKTLEVSEAQ